MRLTVWYAGSTFALLLLATGILYLALVSNLDRQDDQFLVDEVHILQDLLAERPDFSHGVHYKAVSRMANYVSSKPYKAWLNRAIAPLS